MATSTSRTSSCSPTSPDRLPRHGTCRRAAGRHGRGLRRRSGGHDGGVFSQVDPIGFIKDQTDGAGTDKGIDAVGYQAEAGDESGEVPALVPNNLAQTVKATGRLGVVGLHVPAHPGAPSEEAAEGRLLFEIGEFFEKGLSMGTVQANVKSYNPALRDMIVAGRATPSFVVSKRLPLEDAPDPYERFDNREGGYSKVVLDPAA